MRESGKDEERSSLEAAVIIKVVWERSPEKEKEYERGVYDLRYRKED